MASVLVLAGTLCSSVAFGAPDATIYLAGDDFGPLVASFPVVGNSGPSGVATGQPPILTAIASGDTDGDGNQEVYWGDIGFGSGPGNGGCVHKLGDDPSIGGFCGDARIVAIGFADTDGDGRDELFVVQGGVTNAGDCNRTAVAGGDLDGNGLDEVYYGCDDGSVFQSGGAPSSSPIFGCSGAVRGLAITDMNGDGKSDFVTGCADGSILVNGVPTFSATGILRGIAAADIDGNGFGYVVAMENDGSAQVFHTGAFSSGVQTSYQLSGTGTVVGKGAAVARFKLQCTSASPCTKSTLCTVWNANYIDTGFGEDIAAESTKQQMPAAFASYSLLRDGATVMSGNLDSTGCVDVTAQVLNPDGTLAHKGAAWTLKTTTVMTKPIGTGNLTVQVQERGTTVPLPQGVTPDSSPQDPTKPFVVTTGFSITANSLNPKVVPTTMNEMTGVSGVMSAILARPDDLGLKPGTINIYAGQGCPQFGDDNCSPTTEGTDSCASGSPSCPVLYIGRKFTAQGTCPSNVGSGGSNWKYVIAHEFGHIIQSTFGIALHATYTPTIGGRPAVCRCDHVLASNPVHCMQSMNRANDSQLEGFAQFYSANTWNSRNSTSCAFAYYKEFLVTQKPNLPDEDFHYVTDPSENPNPDLGARCSNGTSLPPGDGGPNSYYSILPPMFVDCLGLPGATDPRQFVDYRVQAGCWPAGQPSDYSTEFDWMKFYINLNRNPGAAAAVPITELFNLYASLCSNTNICGGSPTNTRPGWDELNAAAAATFNADQSLAFRTFGQTYGVDRNLP